MTWEINVNAIPESAMNSRREDVVLVATSWDSVMSALRKLRIDRAVSSEKYINDRSSSAGLTFRVKRSELLAVRSR